MDINMKDLGSSLVTGSLIQLMPGILKGAMGEYLGRITLKEFVSFVQKDENLWDKLPGNYQDTLLEYGPKLGSLDWLTVDWAMESGRRPAPVIYSLLVGWPEGRAWLEKQINEIKKSIGVSSGRKNDISNNPQPMSGLREQQEDGGECHQTTEGGRTDT
jgi:hypothetical protein